MNPKDQLMYAELICINFTDNEIEHLEDFSQWAWGKVEQGVKFPEFKSDLILDKLKLYEEGGDDE